MASDWSSLPDEIWGLVFKKLPLEDYTRCSSVCSRFFSVYRDNIASCSSDPRIPWLMIPPDEDDTTDSWRFFDMAGDKMHRIPLPEIRESIVLGSSEGWLILADERTADLRLFNPFTRARIQLPPTASSFHKLAVTERDEQGHATMYLVLDANNVPDEMTPLDVCRTYFRSANLLASSSSNRGGGYTVLVHHGMSSDEGMTFTKAGDNTWTALQTPKCHLSWTGTFSRGLFYVMDMRGQVVSYDLNRGAAGHSDPLPPLQVMRPMMNYFNMLSNYLAVLPESGELVQARWDSIEGLVRAERLDSKVEAWVEVMSLAGHCLFLTARHMQPVCTMCCHPAAAANKVMKGNCLYLAEEGLLRVYDMRARRVETYHHPLFGEIRWSVASDYSPVPYWVTPVVTDLSLHGS